MAVLTSALVSAVTILPSAGALYPRFPSAGDVSSGRSSSLAVSRGIERGFGRGIASSVASSVVSPSSSTEGRRSAGCRAAGTRQLGIRFGRTDECGGAGGRLPIWDASARTVRRRATNGEEETSERQEEDRSRWDVSSNCVTPVFRMSPLGSYESDDANKIHILFLSEGNVCRSIYAEAIFTSLLKQHNLQDSVSCSSKGTRDYNVGETIDPRALAVAEEHGLELPEAKVATIFDCANDIVKSDLLLVMDKFTASDVLKEITVYEMVNKNGWYSGKVRRLGEFCQTKKLEDIEDPLYGNMGGIEELEFIQEVYSQVRGSCEGLIKYVLDVQANLQESESYKDGIARALGRMDKLNWLAPPMLSKI